MIFRYLNLRKGFSFIETLVSIGIASSLTLLISPFIFHQIEEYEQEKAIMSRISLQLQIERVLGAPNMKAFRENTLNGNSQLRACATRTGICNAALNRGFTVIDSNNLILAGTQTNPARFDSNGAPCTGNNCLFEVFASYTSYCLGGAPTCTEATSVTASYTIRQNTVAKQSKGPPFRDIVSPPIPIMIKTKKTPPFKITRYGSGGNLGPHEFCMIQSLNRNYCTLYGNYKQDWIASGSCFATICFDFL